MQMSLFGRSVEVQKAPVEPAPLEDMTWDQFTAWRKTPFTCEWCGKPAIHAGSNMVGPWRIHIGCERDAAAVVMVDAIKQARKDR
jgi:hypothetical protein